MSIAPGPKQSVIRPTEMESEAFSEALTQAALFGTVKIFSPEKPSVVRIKDGALVLSHDQGKGEVRLEPEGGVVIRLPLNLAGHGAVVIEEDVTATLAKALHYGTWLLNKIDPTQRLTHVALAVKIRGGEGGTWRTQKEQDASPTSYPVFMGKPQAVHLRPAHRPRPALTHQAVQLVEDFTALLRREWKKDAF